MIENPKNFEEQFKNFLEYLAGELKGLSKTVKSFDGLLNAEFGDVESGSAGEDVKAFYEKLEQLVQNTVSQTFNTFVENQGNLEEATPEVQQFFNNMEKVIQETVKEYFFNTVEEGGLGGSESLTDEQKKQFIENLGIFDSEQFKTAVQEAVNEAITQVSISFATSEEITAGEVDSKAITPKALKEAGITAIPTIEDASTTQKGIVQLATQEEVSEGTDETKAVTPKSLKNTLDTLIPNIQDASESQKGIIQIASQEEVVAGTDALKAVTPKALKEAGIGEVPFATNEEVLAAIEATKAVAPASLKQFMERGQLGQTKFCTDPNPITQSSHCWVDTNTANLPSGFGFGTLSTYNAAEPSQENCSQYLVDIFNGKKWWRNIPEAADVWSEWHEITDSSQRDTFDKYILKSGNTGTVSAYQANTDDDIGANTEATINKDSAEYLTLPETVTTLTIGDENPNSNSWTKVIALSKAITVTLGTGWVWAGGEAPELAAGIIVATACGASCIASFTKYESVT